MNDTTNEKKIKVLTIDFLKKLFDNTIDKLKDIEYLQGYNKDRNKHFIRRRSLPIENVVQRIFVRPLKSLAISISEFDKHMANTIKERYQATAKVSASAFCQSRQNLDYTLFKDIFTNNVEMRYTPDEDGNVYIKTNEEGFITLAIDGSVNQMADTKENKNIMGETKSQVGTQTHARFASSSIFDTVNRIVVSAEVDEYPIDERMMAQKQVLELEKIIYGFRTYDLLFVMDRGYASYGMATFFLRNSNYFLIRLPIDKFAEEVSQMKSDDEFIEISLSKLAKLVKDPMTLRWIAEQTSTIRLRFTKIVLPTGEIEILVSNLDISRVSYEKMCKYYFDRWRNRSAL